MSDRIPQSTKDTQDYSDAVMKIGNPIIQRNRLADQLYRDFTPTGLMCYQAEIVKTIDVVWVDYKNFPIKCFSLCKLAGLGDAEGPLPPAGGWPQQNSQSWLTKNGPRYPCSDSGQLSALCDSWQRPSS
jgi:hypothetical protein